MKKSYALLFVSALIFMSCNQHPKPLVAQKVDILTGMWTNCSINFFKDGKLSFSQSNNECPDIAFNKDHSGYVKTGSELLFKFSWNLINDTLIINHPKGDHYLDSGSYTLIYKRTKLLNKLGLLNQKKGKEYILAN